MKQQHGFDEVMIVNPGGFNQGEQRMRFHYAPAPGMGYYSQAPGIGYFAEEPYPAEGLQYAQTDPYGYYAEPSDVYGEYEPVGYFADESPLGYYGDEAMYGQYAQPYGYVAEADPYGEYEPMGYYGEMPEMVGYGDEAGEYEPLAEDPGIYSGYQRDMPPHFNAGCPIPTNVDGYEGYGETEPLEGYIHPLDVSPTVREFTPQPGPTPSVPETLRPLW